MSIIYDALQKTQKNREYLKLQSALTQKKSKRPHLKSMLLGSLILLMSGSVGALISFYWEPIKASAKVHPVAKKNPRMKPAPIVKASPPLIQESAHLWITDTRKATKVSPVVLPVAEKAVVQQTARLFASVPQPSPSPSPQTSQVMNTSHLTLNGVLISGTEKIALINSQSFHLGDIIEGMKIVDIEFNSVKLQSGQEIVELRVPV